MRSSILRVFIFVLAVTGCAICANATEAVINFSSLSQSGSGSSSEGNTYTQQGFTFTDELGNNGNNGFAVWDASSPYLPGQATANTSLFEFYAGSTTQLTYAGNQPFTINSIDLAQYDTPQNTGTFDVTFLGTLADNSTVSQTFTVSRSSGTTVPALQTFDFSNFTDVVAVTFTQGSAGVTSGSAYQFDNLDVSVTPEPASMLLFGTGLLGIAFVMRKRLFA